MVIVYFRCPWNNRAHRVFRFGIGRPLMKMGGNRARAYTYGSSRASRAVYIQVSYVKMNAERRVRKNDECNRDDYPFKYNAFLSSSILFLLCNTTRIVELAQTHAFAICSVLFQKEPTPDLDRNLSLLFSFASAIGRRSLGRSAGEFLTSFERKAPTEAPRVNRLSF